MERSMERAIILAAGMGSRLVPGGDYPKPLQPVAGVPLLVRVLRTLAAQGIREAVIVTGHLGESLQKRLAADTTLGLKLVFVANEAFATTKNGVSLLAARAYVEGEVVLTMADHLFAPAIVQRLRDASLPEGACALAVDFDIPRCFDLDDATKVRVQDGQITAIGKELEKYDALDTGLFRIGSELTDELARLFAKTGDCSLSEGVGALLTRGRFFACDVGDARWIDVDTPEALAHAEGMLRTFGDSL